MSAFEQKMSEQMLLICTLIMDINKRSKSHYIHLQLDYLGMINRIVVYFIKHPKQPYPKMAGYRRIYCDMKMESYLSAIYQDDPFPDCCTTDQIIHVLRQVRQAEIQGRTDENKLFAENNSATVTPA